MLIALNEGKMSELQKREQAIFNLIERRSIGTQSQLVRVLVELGFDVTQATVSRDVRRLGLVKKPLPGGGFRYSRPGKREASPRPKKKDGYVTNVWEVESMIAINTLPGRATAVAATIDEADLPEIAGTLAGDNFVLVAIKESKNRRKVQEALQEML